MTEIRTIGVIGLGMILGGLGPGRDLAPATTASLPPAPATPVAMSSATLDQGGAHVELSARRDASGILVRLDARDGTPGTVSLAWDPAASRLVGVRWDGPDAPSFEPAPGRVSLAIPAAAGVELSFEEIVSGGSAVRATLAAAGGDKEVTLRMPR